MSKETTVDGDVVRKLIMAVVVLAVGLVIALIAAVVASRVAADKRMAVLAVDRKGTLVPTVSLDQPYLSEARVVDFADECLRRIFAHDFLHHTLTMPQAQECFTPASGDEFATMMQPRIKLMEEQRMVMASSVISRPRVTRVYKKDWGLGEAQHWDMEALVELSMEGKASRIPPERQIVRLTVTRVPLQQTPKGVQFANFKVAPA